MARRDSPEQLRAIVDPVERAARLSDAYRGIEALRQVRDETIVELRALGWGYGRIAAAIGVTRGRVQQILKEPVTDQ